MDNEAELHGEQLSFLFPSLIREISVTLSCQTCCRDEKQGPYSDFSSSPLKVRASRQMFSPLPKRNAERPSALNRQRHPGA